MLLAAIALSLGLAVGLNVNPPLASAASAMASAATSLATAAGVPSRDSLWLPSAGTTWQIVLQNPVKVSSLAASPQAQAYDIDMFGNSADTISALQSKAIKVICYFSAGTYESYRPDSSQFTPADMGKQLGAWAGEYWLNVSSPNVRNIMAARIRMAAWKGCDAIDPDNMDGYVSTICDFAPYHSQANTTSTGSRQRPGFNPAASNRLHELSLLHSATVQHDDRPQKRRRDHSQRAANGPILHQRGVRCLQRMQHLPAFHRRKQARLSHRVSRRCTGLRRRVKT